MYYVTGHCAEQFKYQKLKDWKINLNGLTKNNQKLIFTLLKVRNPLKPCTLTLT